MNKSLGVYPDISSKNFLKLITRKKEFWDPYTQPNFCFQSHQKFIANFINPLTHYNSILLFAAVGTGKTLGSIAIAENFKKDYRIVVILKNDFLIKTYRNELTLSLCTEYGIRHAQINGVEDLDLKNAELLKLKKSIDRHYTFLTYNDLVTLVLGTRVTDVSLAKTKSKVPKYNKTTDNFNLNGAVVIVDEVHNITEIKVYPILLELLQNAKDTKLVLMTATPIHDNVLEIFEINNLLNAKNLKFQLPTSKSKLIAAGLINKNETVLGKDEYSKDSVGLLSDTSNTITNLGKKALKDTLKGKICYVSANVSNYAKKVFKGTPLNKNSKLIVYKSKMSDHQRAGYLKTLNDPDSNNSLFTNSIYASSIVYPNGMSGVSGYLKNFKKSEMGSLNFLKKENIKKYSSKLYALIDRLNHSKGPSFIYSNLVNNGGLALIERCLLKNGYTRYSETMFKTGNPPGQFITFKGDTKGARFKKLLDIFNSYENRNGDIIKIVLGSSKVSEGVTFKNIRQIHIYDPEWNLSVIDQIIGRGVRFNSHIDLPIKDRVVDIFLHCAMDLSSNSIDYLKYQLSEKKDRAIKEVEYLLRGISVNCYLNKMSGKMGGKMSKLSGKLEDYSRECLYSKCEYHCDYSPPVKKVNERNGNGNSVFLKTNKDTYSVTAHSQEEYNYIKDVLTYLFGIGLAYSLKYLVNYVKKSSKTDFISKGNIYVVLSDLIKSGTVIVNANKNYHLESSGDYIIMVPEKTVVTKKESVYAIPAKVASQKAVARKIKIGISVLNKEIYGSLFNNLGEKDNLFRLVHRDPARKKIESIKNDSGKIKDHRTVTNGKECYFYTKDELIEIMNKLKIKIPEKKVKSKLCSLIFADLAGKNLILN